MLSCSMPRVNPKLLPIKAHFFFFFAAVAPILPFLPIVAKQLGIDALGVGVVFAGNILDKKSTDILTLVFQCCPSLGCW